MSGSVLVPISIGELFDKLSILAIKAERIADQAKLANVNFERSLLQDIAAGMEFADSERIQSLFLKLKDLNMQIWDAEDRIRDFESQNLFGDRFLETARSIYHLNDARAAIKRELSILTSSSVVEEKSYRGT